MSHSFNIGDRVIGPDEKPYIIAEMSANHNGKMENAFKILRMAKRAGADAVKMQTYTASTITIDNDSCEFVIQGGLWDGKKLYDLYEEAHTPWEWHKPLFEEAKKIGITIFSSPFDFSAVDLLEDLNVPAYKIASFECIDLPLIKYVAQTRKPMIISTGMADSEEINEAVECARENGCRDLALLHCVSGYPAPLEDYNLKTLTDLADCYKCQVGLSDHTLNNITSIASIPLGATIIEKHVTLDRSAGGPDDSFSLEEKELMELCRDAYSAWQALGKIDYSRKSSEKGNAIFRRSLYIVKDIKAGECFNSENVRSIRPGYGLKPKYYEEILGRKAASNISSGTALSWELIEK